MMKRGSALLCAVLAGLLISSCGSVQEGPGASLTTDVQPSASAYIDGAAE